MGHAIGLFESSHVIVIFYPDKMMLDKEKQGESHNVSMT
jgi:hypothetical protein